MSLSRIFAAATGSLARTPAPRPFAFAAAALLLLSLLASAVALQVIHAGLPLWLHIPLVAFLMVASGLSAAAGGGAAFEWRLRSSHRQGGSNPEPTGP